MCYIWAMLPSISSAALQAPWWRRLMGVEVEISAASSADDVADVAAEIEGDLRIAAYLGSDASVSGLGLEMSLGPAAGFDFFLKIEKIRDLLRAIGARADRTCGLHVHTDARGISFRRLRPLAMLWSAVEPAAYAVAGQHRRHNRFCGPTALSLTSYLKPCPAGAWAKEFKAWAFDYRYRSLNWRALLAHRTLEVRLAAGACRSERLVHWPLISHSLVSYGLASNERDIATLILAAQSPLGLLLRIVRESGLSEAARWAEAEADDDGAGTEEWRAVCGIAREWALLSQQEMARCVG
jgi:hypothetical protein